MLALRAPATSVVELTGQGEHAGRWLWALVPPGENLPTAQRTQGVAPKPGAQAGSCMGEQRRRCVADTQLPKLGSDTLGL